ncbi:NAD-dependent protein deacetylase sirtuin-1 [Homalodisca vitripennis]|nr:NAD-dependent protein deacetylase sirtuin-1 [Homalodisca vitripennis]
MASDLEEQSYSCPPKRLKLDNSSVLCNRTSETEKVSFSASFSVPETSRNRDIGLSSELKRKSPDDNSTSFDPTLSNHHQSQDGGLEDDDDDVSSTVSNLSDLSGLSDISGQDWKPIAGPMSWVQKQMLNGVNPRTLLSQMMGDTSHVPTQVDDLTLWKIIVSMLSEPPRRMRLRHINSLNDVIQLLNTCSRIIVLTGAGVSVSCGIPDFRSRDGIYSRLAVDFPNLPDPQAMFDINYFRQDPRPFFKFAREIYPGQFKPSPCHRFIKMLERQKKLLRNYTQNIDTLEQVAGIENVVECHGSFATASCTVCGHKVTADDIRTDVFQQKIPQCPVCPANSGKNF